MSLIITDLEFCNEYYSSGNIEVVQLEDASDANILNTFKLSADAEDFLTSLHGSHPRIRSCSLECSQILEITTHSTVMRDLPL